MLALAGLAVALLTLPAGYWLAQEPPPPGRSGPRSGLVALALGAALVVGIGGVQLWRSATRNTGPDHTTTRNPNGEESGNIGKRPDPQGFTRAASLWNDRKKSTGRRGSRRRISAAEGSPCCLCRWKHASAALSD